MTKRRSRVSEAVIRRLPKYYRYISEMKDNGVQRVSSNELGQKMGLTASQIRQDFNCFGGFGQQGYGYNVPELCGEIKKIIGLNRQYNMIVVGAGNLGQALANYSGFEKEGFNIKALFDINPRLLGMSIRGIDILDIDTMKSYTANNPIDIGVICTPKEKAQEVAELLVDCGIKNIWNFAPVDVVLPDDVVVENVHLSDSLYILCYRMATNS
ncbi:MAG: redox-sensing transcriptional repressor Rex [Clostridiales bacterium]|jgi:redox-sensing transcriptional repressor|nr:redox-sensing transcriptional repressor Rex [Clostridiales bacterium]